MPAKKKTKKAFGEKTNWPSKTTIATSSKKKTIVKTLEPLKTNGVSYGVGEIVKNPEVLDIPHLVKNKVIEVIEE